jgi:hypothetical protein
MVCGVHAIGINFNFALGTYDETGKVDYLDVLNNAVDAYTNLTVVGGTYEFEHDGQLKCWALICTHR